MTNEDVPFMHLVGFGDVDAAAEVGSVELVPLVLEGVAVLHTVNLDVTYQLMSETFTLVRYRHYQ